MQQRLPSMLLLIIFGHTLLTAALPATSVTVPVTSAPTNANDCFEEYLQQTRNATTNYASAYSECHQLGNQKRLMYTQQKQPLRQQVTSETSDMCAEFERCDQLQDDFEFFQCYGSNSLQNTHTLLQLHLNASAAIVDLEQQYNQAEKELMLCTIAVEREYVDTTMASYDTLMQCLTRAGV